MNISKAEKRIINRGLYAFSTGHYGKVDVPFLNAEKVLGFLDLYILGDNSDRLWYDDFREIIGGFDDNSYDIKLRIGKIGDICTNAVLEISKGLYSDYIITEIVNQKGE